MYRLLADVLNDIGFVLDCLSPVFPKPIRVVILSFSSVLRALCGVAAGSAKASLSAHFARWGNLGELNAKDSSQETVISLVGMLVGSLVVSWVTTPLATWTTLILLLSIHLETNRRAVRAVSMRTFNRQRATLVYHQLCREHVPTPEEISAQERIFERDGVLRAANGVVLGYCAIGVSFLKFLRATCAEQQATRSFRSENDVLSDAFALFRDRGYILHAINASERQCQVLVIIKQGASNAELLTAWWQALSIAHDGSMAGASKIAGTEEAQQRLRRSMSKAADLLNRHKAGLTAAGWDLDANALETMPGSRILAEI